MNHIHHLSEVIGPRGSCSHEESLASAYIQSEFTKCGYEATSIDKFQADTTFSWAQLVLIFSAIVCFALTCPYHGCFYQPIIAAPISIVTLVIYLLQVDTRFSISSILPKHRSQNVHARKPSSSVLKIMLIAHYDSSRSSLNFHPKLVGDFRRSFILLVCSMFACAFLCVAHLVVDRLVLPYSRLLFFCSIPSLIVLSFVCFTLLHREFCCQLVKGANDNGSGVAVLLNVAKSLAGSNLQHNVEFLATGAEESGTCGILEYISKNDISNTLFINLDNLGKGNLFVTTSEGILKKYKVNENLLKSVEALINENYPKLKLPRTIS
ncbi:hypothetical protein GEMRC1_004685 [Eukaryota sp. GEM-RC1]